MNKKIENALIIGTIVMVVWIVVLLSIVVIKYIGTM